MKMNCYVQKFILQAMVIIGFAAFGIISHALSEDPQTVVKQTVDEVLVILRDKRLAKPENKKERQQLIKTTIDKRFDYEEMSKQTLARHWRDRTPEEQKRFIELFSRLLEKTYISKIESYSDEEILVKEQLVKSDKAMVRTVILKNNVEIPILYKLHNKDGKWMVYGVVVEGVSLIRNYRTQFDSIINKEKYAGLLHRIEEKINDNEAALN